MSLSVLIADHSASDRESLISAMPDHWDVTLSEASTGNEALAACSRGHASVLFLDLMLPGMTGLELIEALQRVNAATTVIIVSDEAPAALRGQIRASGAVAFVEKPVRREALESVLTACGLYVETAENEADFAFA
ncbi:MAG: response regulator [Janthinobacterium lividum]